MILGVFKLTSCGGCQYSILDLGKSLLEQKIFYFTEISSSNLWHTFDVAFVEGSVTNDDEKELLLKIRQKAKFLVALGACAVSGGIQAIQRSKKDKGLIFYSYPLSDFVSVDLELRGCPVKSEHIEETLFSLSVGSVPYFPDYPLCIECKRKGNPCLMITHKILCLGVITQGGCGALCPSLNRGCYGCFGPVKGANLKAFFRCALRMGLTEEKIREIIMNSFNGYHQIFRELYDK
ncbi:MAG: hypothetical protein N2Z40_02875 [Caldimicrobium sp.]|nr:hypothetical protein [Caldimicrobium sp.]MCX7613150.1 hypothetical protein [Caldimicrobium sp.]MDW8183243.1 hypothetical protein [Caldimicrobium sp.]